MVKGLLASPQVLCQESLGHGVESQSVHAPAQTVPLIRKLQVGHGDAVGLHGLNHPIRLGLVNARIVAAVGDQQGPHDAVGVGQRRTLAHHRPPLFRAWIPDA